jgi:mono/diheme cytochrome c family protein
MKAFLVLFGIIVIIVAANTTFVQAEDQQVPLTREQVALIDGEELYLELCAVCHGKGGMGGGPAAAALKDVVPDLTGLAARNDGTFPRKAVENSIAGETRAVAHGTVEMPIWGQVFEGERPDWKQFRREALARHRVYNLTAYLETIQAE